MGGQSKLGKNKSKGKGRKGRRPRCKRRLGDGHTGGSGASGATAKPSRVLKKAKEESDTESVASMEVTGESLPQGMALWQHRDGMFSLHMVGMSGDTKTVAQIEKDVKIDTCFTSDGVETDGEPRERVAVTRFDEATLMALDLKACLMDWSDIDYKRDQVIIEVRWDGAIFARATSDMCFILNLVVHNPTVLVLDHFGKVTVDPHDNKVRLPRNSKGVVTTVTMDVYDHAIQRCGVYPGGSFCDDMTTPSSLYRTWHSCEDECNGRLNLIVPQTAIALPKGQTLYGEGWVWGIYGEIPGVTTLTNTASLAEKIGHIDVYDVRNISVGSGKRKEYMNETVHSLFAFSRLRHYATSYSTRVHVMPTRENPHAVLERMNKLQTSYWAMFFADLWHIINRWALHSSRLYNSSSQFVVCSQTDEDFSYAITNDEQYTNDFISGGKIDRLAFLVRTVASILGNMVDIILDHTPCFDEPGLLMHLFLEDAAIIGKAVSVANDMLERVDLPGAFKNRLEKEVKFKQSLEQSRRDMMRSKISSSSRKRGQNPFEREAHRMSMEAIDEKIAESSKMSTQLVESLMAWSEILSDVSRLENTHSKAISATMHLFKVASPNGSRTQADLHLMEEQIGQEVPCDVVTKVLNLMHNPVVHRHRDIAPSGDANNSVSFSVTMPSKDEVIRKCCYMMPEKVARGVLDFKCTRPPLGISFPTREDVVRERKADPVMFAYNIRQDMIKKCLLMGRKGRLALSALWAPFDYFRFTLEHASRMGVKSDVLSPPLYCAQSIAFEAIVTGGDRPCGGGSTENERCPGLADTASVPIRRILQEPKNFDIAEFTGEQGHEKAAEFMHRRVKKALTLWRSALGAASPAPILRAIRRHTEEQTTRDRKEQEWCMRFPPFKMADPDEVVSIALRVQESRMGDNERSDIFSEAKFRSIYSGALFGNDTVYVTSLIDPLNAGTWLEDMSWLGTLISDRRAKAIKSAHSQKIKREAIIRKKQLAEEELERNKELVLSKEYEVFRPRHMSLARTAAQACAKFVNQRNLERDEEAMKVVDEAVLTITRFFRSVPDRKHPKRHKDIVNNVKNLLSAVRAVTKSLAFHFSEENLQRDMYLRDVVDTERDVVPYSVLMDFESFSSIAGNMLGFPEPIPIIAGAAMRVPGLVVTPDGVRREGWRTIFEQFPHPRGSGRRSYAGEQGGFTGVCAPPFHDPYPIASVPFFGHPYYAPPPPHPYFG